MEVTAKLISIGQATEGTSQKGAWRKAIVVFETEEQYPKKLAIDFFNANLEAATKIKVGSVCKVKFDISSREWNGKWYTDLKGFGIEAVGAAQPQTQQQQQEYFGGPAPQGEVDDGLPF